ncbi:GNAT family N-acetyltransferase [Sphingosinicella sp. LHD-64]|uniref:GNAT family N-acetyltransferase n=1 Tax=Sphingosinicella sp. LHD-64 TaxID=3072139 RepID=UPI00280FC2A2|nr:GNAT family N-acetyltransferase [Sphingosinicella sp. LHD-64]MDQ8756418.1 GNAT family N-acetyltransferase [Sphingosinicella sp. LHD-64]
MAAEPPRWRPARVADAGAIAALAAAVLGPYGEDAAIYAERIALAPEGCLVLARGDEILGHFLSHPWPRGAVPEINALLGAIPDDADGWYVHDVVIAPEARGGGFAASALATIAVAARARGIDRLTLIAVGGADRFWSRHGFEPGEAERPLAADKVYMERPA